MSSKFVKIESPGASPMWVRPETVMVIGQGAGKDGQPIPGMSLVVIAGAGQLPVACSPQRLVEKVEAAELGIDPPADDTPIVEGLSIKPPRRGLRP